MSLADRCSSNFSAAVRSKGNSYYNGDRVEILVPSDGDALVAQVHGSRSQPYEVTLDWSGPKVGMEVSCSCPHFDEGNFCKHIWATVQEADEIGAVATLPGRGKLSLRQDFGEGEDDFDDEDYEEDYESDEAFEAMRDRIFREPKRARATRRKKTVRGKSKASSWHDALADQPQLAIRSVQDSLLDQLVARRRTVCFVLDMMASVSAGALVVMLYQRETRKDGKWGKIKQLRTQKNDLSKFEPEDAELLALALGNYGADPSKWERQYAPHDFDRAPISQVEITPATHAVLLPKLCATERFGWVVGDEQPAEDAQILSWDDGPAWTPRLRIEADDKKKKWTIRGELTRVLGDSQPETLPLAKPVFLLSSGVVLFADHVARMQTGLDFRWVSLLRQHEQIEVPYADRARLLKEICAGPSPIEVVWPDNLQLEAATAEPVGHLKVHPERDESKVPRWQRRSGRSATQLYADVSFVYGEQQVAAGSADRAIVDPETDKIMLRDFEAEAKLFAQLGALKLAPKTGSYYEQNTPGSLEFHRNRLAEVVDRLVRDGWQVEAEGHKVRAAGEFSLRVSSGVDWFDVESEIDFGDATASLPSLLAAVKKGESYVVLDDGSRGLLPQEWLERFAPLAEFAEVEGDALRFKPSQALLLDALLADRADDISLEVDKQFATYRSKLKSFSGVSPANAPRGFHGELRDYQKEGLGWLKFLQEFRLGGCLADDMGLGKTIQVLALLLTRRQRRLKKGEERLPSLVVAPKSVVFNWELEAEKFTPTLDVLNYTGLERKEWDDELNDFNVILTTYGTLRRDIETFSKMKFDYAILDESQAIKNDKSQTAKASRLLQADHRLTLTGTPVENHLGELWSQFEFLNPGMLGRSAAFRGFGKSIASDDSDNGQSKALETLRAGLAPFILRRNKEEVLTDLPEKNEQTLYCDLLPADRKKYNELRDYYRNSLLKRIDTSGMNKAKMHVLEALLRLRQTACHSGLVDKQLVNKPSAKIDALVEQLTEVASEGHKALVFSQFTSLLAIVRKRLDKLGIRYEYLDGKTRDRRAKVESFQNDADCPAFLISLKAGGTGLNLTAADYVFLLDPWWNPAVEAQAIDRAHRIGQTRRVFAYRLIARDTVEEKIVEMQKKKRKLADAIISGSGAVMSGLTVEDLQALLS